MIQGERLVCANDTVSDPVLAGWIIAAYGKDDLAKVAVPVLIILGDRDDFFPIEDALALHRMLPNSKLAIAPGASHTILLFRDKPAVFGAPIMDFLARQYPAP